VLCAVFVPCAFISGITGRFFRQFAVTISASTVISAINALTMTPSRALLVFKSKEAHGGGHEHEKEALPWWIFGLCGLITVQLLPTLIGDRLTALGMPDPAAAEEGRRIPTWITWSWNAILFVPGMIAGLILGWFIIRPVNFFLGLLFRGFNRAFDGLTNVYGWTIAGGLHLSVVVLVAYAGLLLLTWTVFQTAPTGFVPQQDMGRLIVSVQLPDSSSLLRTQEAVAKVEKIIREDQGVAHTVGLCGISFVEQANGPNFGSLFVILKPFAQRQDRALKDEAIMKRLRKRWAEEVKEARVVVSGSSPIPGLSVTAGFKVIVEDRGGLGLPTLQAQADRLVGKVAAIEVGSGKALAGVATQFRSNTPQLFLDIDRTKAASLGVDLADVNQTLEIYLGSLYVNSFNEFGRHWQVTIQADKQFRSFVEDINLLQVRNKQGRMVPMGTLVTVKDYSGPLFVKRYNLYTAAPLTGSLLPGVSTGEVIHAVDEASLDSLPRSMKAEWTELMFMQIREGNTTGIVFALAVVAVFLALSALYESWSLPLAVILVVPMCVLSSLTGALVTNISLNIFVQIGLVVLVGLACKNAILVVEFAKQLHVEGKSVFEATLEASKLRLRPILMTSFAFILGVVPLCVASGAGAEMRRSLGIAVFSGMLGVTAFGIFLTPVFFYVIQGVGETRLFAGASVRWYGSLAVGGVLGAGTGYLLGRLSVVNAFWAPIVGAFAGVLIVMFVLTFGRRLRTWK
jgi:multidrug efflux pump